MKKYGIVYAFIDGNNLYLGVKNSKWTIDLKKFRIWLKDKFGVTTAYYFIGYTKEQNDRGLYSFLESAGYKIVFKPTIKDKKGKIKGNVDADLVLQAMIDYQNYDKAIIVTSDGDFYSLVRYWRSNQKLLYVISPYGKGLLSKLLRKEAKEKVLFLDQIRSLVEYKK